MIYKLKFDTNYGERKQITSKSKAIMTKPNYVAQDLVTKLKLLKGKTTLGIQLLKVYGLRCGQQF